MLQIEISESNFRLKALLVDNVASSHVNVTTAETTTHTISHVAVQNIFEFSSPSSRLTDVSKRHAQLCGVHRISPRAFQNFMFIPSVLYKASYFIPGVFY